MMIIVKLIIVIKLFNVFIKTDWEDFKWIWELKALNGFCLKARHVHVRLDCLQETIDTQKLKGATAMQYYFALAAFWSKNMEQVLRVNLFVRDFYPVLN